MSDNKDKDKKPPPIIDLFGVARTISIKHSVGNDSEEGADKKDKDKHKQGHGVHQHILHTFHRPGEGGGLLLDVSSPVAKRKKT